MKLRCRLACQALASLLIAPCVHAGLLDSAAPVLQSGAQARIVYRMGAVHFEPGGWVDTTVSCTNLATAPATIGIEVFDENDHVAGQLAKATVAAGAAVTFATSSDAGRPDAVTILGLPPIDHGKARVSASSTELACTALNRMRGTDGTIKESPLELIKKVAY